MCARQCRGTGCHDDPIGAQHNSWEDIFGTALHVVEPKLDRSDILPAPTDQGQTESCVAHAFCNAICSQLRHNGELVERPSPRVAWDMILGRMGRRGINMGTSPYAAIEALRIGGFAPESVVPWSPDTAFDELSVDEYQGAWVQAGVIAHRLEQDDSTIQSCRIARQHGKGVVVCTDVDDAFGGWYKGVWPGMQGERVGSHAQCLWDYPDGLPRLLGSYGKGWAEQGLITTTWDVIGKALSIWIIDSSPQWRS